MVVRNNLAAVNAHRLVSQNNGNAARNLERLATGHKINRAGDNASGLAISERMRGQIRGVAMAEQNAENGISLIKTAEGGLNETHAIIHRMRELAVQAANGTYNEEDRRQINAEFRTVISEIDRIAQATHYNGINLLNGSLGGTPATSLSGLDGAPNGSQMAAAQHFQRLGFFMGLSAPANTLNSITLASYSNRFNGEMANLVVTSAADTNSDQLQIALQVGDQTLVGVVANNAEQILDDGSTVTFPFPEDVIVFLDGNGHMLASLSSRVGATSFRVFDTPSPADSISGVITNIAMSPAESAFPASTNTIPLITENHGSNPLGSNHPLSNAMFTFPNDQLIFQVGANGVADQRVGLTIGNMSSATLGQPVMSLAHPDLNLLTVANANDSIRAIDRALEQVSNQRAVLGALQNRMEHTINNLGVTRENLTAAESTIRDTDMAGEMMHFTKNNILLQASQAMLAQAQQLPQGVLSLLQ